MFAKQQRRLAVTPVLEELGDIWLYSVLGVLQNTSTKSEYLHFTAQCVKHNLIYVNQPIH